MASFDDEQSGWPGFFIILRLQSDPLLSSIHRFRLILPDPRSRSAGDEREDLTPLNT